MKRSLLFPIISAIQIACLLLCMGCEGNTLGSNRFKTKHFPIAIGNYWKYQVHESIFSTIDTLTATVVEEGIDIRELTDLWKMEWKNADGELIQIQYLHFTSDSISFYNVLNSSNLLQLEARYHFPFKAEDIWRVNRYFGKYEVVASDIPSSDYNLDYGTGFLCERTASPGLTFIIDQSLLIKNIGIVWREYYEHLTEHKVYHLIEYKIGN